MHEAPTQQTHAAAATAAREGASKLWRRGWEINLQEMKFSPSLPIPLSIFLLSGRLEQMSLAGDWRWRWCLGAVK